MAETGEGEPAGAGPDYSVEASGDTVLLELSGDWTGDDAGPGHEQLRDACLGQARSPRRWLLAAAEGFRWDSRTLARLYHLARAGEDRGIELDTTGLPEGMRTLLGVAHAVRAGEVESEPQPPPLARIGARWLRRYDAVLDFIAFIGDGMVALLRFASGRSHTRVRDLFYFIDQTGPRALGIVALISVLVGMILAYLGSVQLRQFGAEVYVANLVAVGMVREMGPLMTAVILAGRTGAAYAAQLGAMQANEEIDAVTTLGLSPMEYLVLPRLLALVLVMPLLVIFSDVVGLVGGALVASGMEVNFSQFLYQARDAVGLGDIATGLVKSVVFALLIATAGCQSGLMSGRSSAAVGTATTRAVVHAIVYLVAADAGLNILYDKMGV
jgi:phospholipid/cholesterol/gamma-HCH transport system permease protein